MLFLKANVENQSPSEHHCSSNILQHLSGLSYHNLKKLWDSGSGPRDKQPGIVWLTITSDIKIPHSCRHMCSKQEVIMKIWREKQIGLLGEVINNKNSLSWWDSSSKGQLRQKPKCNYVHEAETESLQW